MNKIKTGVIPAAGRGMRAYPKTNIMPKPMFEIEGKPILQRNIELMRDKLDIKNIFIVVNYMGDSIKRYFGNGNRFGVNITYITNKRINEGLLGSIYCALESVKNPFVCILGDEVYLDSNHNELKEFIKKRDDFDVICSVKRTDNPDLIKKNYSVEVNKERITSITEKPKHIVNDLLGCGTYVFNAKFFDYLKELERKNPESKPALMTLIGNMAREKGKVYSFELKGDYINVNTVEDLNTTNYFIRSKNFEKYKVNLIIPALNEEESIAKVIKEFRGCKDIDNITVVDTNSTDKTVEIAKSLGVEVITKEKLVNGIKTLPGYGDKLKYGMDNSNADILILTEADGTFRSKDIGKILEYMKDADMVIGTRTTRQMIEQGSNMGWFLRWGNVFLGKLIEALWWGQEPRFTDVGCTFRAIWKDSYNKIRSDLHASGPEFSPEMMIEALKARLRVIEIPVSYYQRFKGESKHSKGFKKIKTGLKMLNVILGKKFGWKK